MPVLKMCAFAKDQSRYFSKTFQVHGSCLLLLTFRPLPSSAVSPSLRISLPG